MPVETRTQTTPHKGAADELWRELHARLRGFVRARISDPDAADDVAQEVLLRLHRNLGALRAEDRLDAFAYRIARNAIIDHYRSRATAKETRKRPTSSSRGSTRTPAPSRSLGTARARNSPAALHR